jgi:formamidopyrimidine-DNA glycosylase
MPELPEVEMMAGLAREVGLGRELVKIETLDPRVWGAQDPLTGLGRIQSIWRRAKLLILEDSHTALLIHFRMTGQLIRKQDGRRARLRFLFGDGGHLVLVDSRCLGTVESCSLDELELRLQGLGEEFWPGPQSGVWWSNRMGNGGIKAAMLRQNRVVGIGNIAASEILWMAKISPTARCSELNLGVWDRFSEAAEQHVADSLGREDGDSLRYLKAGGDNPFLVYGRENQPCPRCQSPIRRWVQQARSTFYCAQCQA